MIHDNEVKKHDCILPQAATRKAQHSFEKNWKDKIVLSFLGLSTLSKEDLIYSLYLEYFKLWKPF